ncbi:MAG: AraC family transcriptional regulator [Planctomycetia bacterium]|nr:AraC family transcriptional regulator [Planctomycetia bacterium]
MNERTIIDLLAYGFHDVPILGRYIYLRACPPLESHDQGELLEFSFLAQGHQTFCVEGKEFPIYGGDIIAIFPSEVHGSGSYREEKGIMYWILVRPPLNDRKFLGTTPEEGKILWETLMTLPNRVIRATSSSQKYLENVFALISRYPVWLNSEKSSCQLIEKIKSHPLGQEQSSTYFQNKKRKIVGPVSKLTKDKKDYLIFPGAGNQSLTYQEQSILVLRIQNLILSFLLDIIESSRSLQFKKSDKIRKVVDELEQSPNKMLSIREMARIADISEWYFIKLFKKEVGISPADYQLRKKIEYSMNMLADSDISITDIAIDLGFSSSQYFATVFKKYMCVTPSEYRQQLFKQE